MAFSNVASNDTVDVWRVRTNQMIIVLNGLELSNANSAYSAAGGAHAGANTAFAHANLARNFGNTTNAVAVSAYNFANTINVVPAFSAANTAAAAAAAAHATANLKASLTGAIFSGGVTLNDSNGAYRLFNITTNGIARWAFGGDTYPEVGANTGSNFDIWRYDDNGGLIDVPVTLNRATGVITFLSPQGPTAAPGTSNTLLATTAFVTTAVSSANSTGTAAAAFNKANNANITAVGAFANANLTLIVAQSSFDLGNTINLIARSANATAIAAWAAVGDANTAKLNVENQIVIGGATVNSKSLGVQTSGTLTVDPGDRGMQHVTANGAFTLAPGSSIGMYSLDVTMGSAASTITTSGWTKVVGSFTYTSGYKYRCSGSIGIAGSLLVIQGLQ